MARLEQSLERRLPFYHRTLAYINFHGVKNGGLYSWRSGHVSSGKRRLFLVHVYCYYYFLAHVYIIISLRQLSLSMLGGSR